MNQLETPSYGAPMVCSAFSGASEPFRNGVHGYLCKSKDEYIEAIEKLLADERKAWEMGYVAWNLCRKKYTWNHHTRTLIQLLEVHG